jgi:hypothetical protein
MSLDQAKAKMFSLLADVGRGTLHTLYPNEFEYYMMTFELINSSGKREDMLVFPVLPQEIRYSINTLSSTRKTSGGVVSLFNPTFVPFSISIQGTFGKKLRILLGDSEVLSLGFNLRTKLGKQTGSKPESIFNTKIKTGYGVTKLLEQIIQKSQSLDDNQKPYKLIFYDSSFNNDNVVEIESYSFSQSESSNNGWWDYNVQMRAIAPALAVRKNSLSSTIRLIGLNEVNKFVQGYIDNNRTGFYSRLNKATD